MSQQQNKPGANRPGAMTQAMAAVQRAPAGGPKVLRIGVIQNGKIVETKVIRKRETVLVGPSERNHIIVNAKGLPAKFQLFQLVNNEYILNFTEEMRGRVGLPSTSPGDSPAKKLADIKRSGLARKSGGSYQIKLGDTSRGKIVIGDTQLLFSFVPPPPITPRPQLPAAARGGFVKSIDWLFTAFVVLSYMTFFGFVIYLENADWEIDNDMNAYPERLAELFFDEPTPPEEPEEVEATDEEGEEPEEEEAEATPTPTKRPTKQASGGDTGRSDPAASAEARARIVQEAAAQAEAMLIGALSDEGGALADVLAGGAVTGSAEDVMAQAGSVGVADRSSGALRSRSGGGSGQRGRLGSLQGGMGGGGMAASEGEVIVERRIRGRINLGMGGGDIGGSGDFDARLVQRQIRARLRAIQRCYENELRRNPTLAGKVTVQFTIVERGTVSAARASENTTGSPAVANCVVRTVRRFRFNPGPDGGSVQFRYPFVFAPQN